MKGRLCEAIRKGDLLELRQLSEAANTDFARERHLHSLLATALKLDRLEIAEWLVRQGCPVSSTDPAADSPFRVAVQRGQRATARWLLGLGADPGARGPAGETVLHAVCAQNDLELATELLRRDRSLADVRDYSLSSGLHVAVEAGHLELVELLLGYGADADARTLRPGFEGCAPLHIAVLRGYRDVVRVLLERRADVNATVGIRHDPDGRNYTHAEYDAYTPLHLAVKMNFGEIRDLLLRYGADVNAVIEYSFATPLHLAVLQRDEKSVMVFSEWKANFQHRTADGKNVLHLAIESHWPKLLQVLLKKNADVNDRTNEGDTLLHVAARVQDSCIIKILLENHADVNVKNSTNQTPLHIAASGNKEIVEILLNAGAKIDEIDDNNQSPLGVAIKHRGVEIVSVLLKYNPSIQNSANKFAFISAVNEFHTYRKIVPLLVNYGFYLLDDKQDYHILLAKYADQNHCELVEMIFNIIKKKNLDLKKDDSIVYRAVRKNHNEIVKIFIKHGFNINYTDNIGQTLLHCVIEHNNIELVKFFIKEGATIRNSDIWNAAKFSDMCIVRILIEHGIDVNICDEFGTTLLHLAVWHKNFELVQLLLKKNTRVNSIENKSCIFTNNNNNKIRRDYMKNLHMRIFTSPLHIAVNKNRKDICLALLENLADVNSKDGYGRTPLHVASISICNETINIIKILMRYGADINALDNKNKLPIYYIYNQDCSCNDTFKNQYELYHECECTYVEEVEDIIKIFIKQIALLNSMNKKVHEDNIKILSKYNDFDKMQLCCMSEIVSMRETKVFDNVSFYDFLVKNDRALIAYVRNKELIEAFKSSDYKNQFQLYADVLEERFGNAQYRQHLMTDAISIINKITYQYYINFPPIVSEKIINFLNLNDLKNLTIAPYICDNSINMTKQSKKFKSC